MQRVNQAVYKRLRELLPEQVAIYPGIADEETQFPYCVYNSDSFSTDMSKDGIEGYQFSYTIQLWATTFDECDNLATIVGEGMNGRIGAEIDAVLSGGSSGYEGAFLQVLNFNIDT